MFGQVSIQKLNLLKDTFYVGIKMSNICKGVVLTTKKPCTKSVTLNGFCGRHQEQLFIFNAKEKGEVVCRQFDRGCRNYICKEDKDAKMITCKQCREKLLGKVKECEHDGCNHKTEGANRFCGKHSRDHFREKEATTDIRYCNIDRGCASVLTDREKVCADCNNNIKQKITKRLHDLRIVETLCLKCHESPKSNGCFCDTCHPSITFVDSDSKRDINDIWNDIYKGAVERNNLILLPFTVLSATIICPCFYCGKFSKNGFVGIDRYDNTKGYILSNIKPCCKDCNMMKNDMPPQAFIDKAKSIVDFKRDNTSISIAYVEKWKEIYRTKGTKTYTTYKNNVMNHRHIPFNLTEKEYDTFLDKSCYLCGISTSHDHKNGIDRIDNTKGYSSDNCKSCCTHCNLMKKSSDLSVFLEHCALITNYCSLDGESIISHETSPRLVKHVELYRSTDIYEFIKTHTLENFCEWAKEEGKTPQFIQGVRDIHEKKLEKEDTLSEIQRQMEMERTRLYKERTEDHVVKHYTASSVHAMLCNGEYKKFQEWYEKTFGISKSFQEQLETLVATIASLSSSDGTDLCRKFLKAEAGRRKSMLKTNIKHNMKQPEIKATWVAKVIPPVPVLNVIEYEVPISPQPTQWKASEIYNVVPSMSEFIQPKQWKALEIYNAVHKGNGEQYKIHCEKNNVIEDVAKWESDWSTFSDTVLKSDTFETVKEHISTFIITLRSGRHKKLLDKKDVLEREDRQVWPKETVHKAFLEGKLTLFKKFNEDNGEKGEIWDKRWNKLINDLEATTDETQQLETIRKFQTNVRVARYRAR